MVNEVQIEALKLRVMTVYKITIECNDHDTIGSIKDILEPLLDCPTDSMRVLKNGYYLRSGQTIGSLNLKEDSVIYLVATPRMPRTPALPRLTRLTRMPRP